MRAFALVSLAILLVGCATSTTASNDGAIAARAQAFIEAQQAIDQRECAAQHGSSGPAYQTCLEARTVDRQAMLKEMLNRLQDRHAALARQCYDPLTGAPAVCYDI